MDSKIKIGISSCLLGRRVRYDGGHKHDRFLTDTLGKYVDYVPVCPETECGLGVPREAMRLVGDPDHPRLVTINSNIDHTERMERWANSRLIDLENEALCGFIFKKNSPSSGMERVKVYPQKGGPPKTAGVGIFARMFMAHFPLLPVEEEGRLLDPKLRENFIERIFVFKRWREFVAEGKSMKGLIEFHTRHKLSIMAHSPDNYRKMGKLVGESSGLTIDERCHQYKDLLMETMRRTATNRKNANVLHHMMGYFKKQLSSDEKQELLDAIDTYRQEQTPLIVPLTLINHYIRKYDQPYLKKQVYLNPHPTELHLRNHV